MPQRDAQPGLILVGHGTRSAAGTQQFSVLAGQLAAALEPVPVEPAFLELQQPDIAAGVSRLVDRGVSRIVVCPLLLFAAGHAKDDVPNAVAAALANAGLDQRINMVQAGHLGCHPNMVGLSRQRFLQSLAGGEPIAADETALVLVGRGSTDAAAMAEMHRFAQLRHDASLTAEARVAFVAMASPSLASVLAELADSRVRRVVVQPHLLFEGEIVERIRQQVAESARRNSERQWLVTPLLADPFDPQPRNENRRRAQDSLPGGNQFLCQVLAEQYRAAIRVVATSSAD